MNKYLKKEDTDTNIDIFERISVKEDFSYIKENLKRIDWPGRMEVLSQDPFVILDACINSASCKHVLQVLEYLFFQFLVF